VFLTKDEEEALEGKYGDAIAIAYKILVAIGESTEADRLIPVEWSHVAGVNYNTIGDAGLKFLEDLSKKDAKVKVKTTLNPMGYDPNKPRNLKSEFIKKQQRIINAYRKMGIENSFTCIPYEVYQLPKKGTNVSFAESNAAIYSNSILELKTNKESALSALASAITGKSIYSGLRLEENRVPKININVKHQIKSELDFALLGYFAGKINEMSINFSFESGIDLNDFNIKPLCAALGTSGSTGMFTINKKDNYVENFDFTQEDAKRMKDEITNADKGDLIVFGSPQLGIKEVEILNSLINKGNRKFKKRCIIFCAREVYNKAKKKGYIDNLERANAEIYCDSCSCLTPLVNRNEIDSILTNSVKAAYYLRNWNKVNVSLKSMKEIVNEECI